MYPKSATYSAPSDSDIQNGIGTLNPKTLTITAKGYHDEREREGERDKGFYRFIIIITSTAPDLVVETLNGL